MEKIESFLAMDNDLRVGAVMIRVFPASRTGLVPQRSRYKQSSNSDLGNPIDYFNAVAKLFK
jgi:hypothetical protein